MRQVLLLLVPVAVLSACSSTGSAPGASSPSSAEGTSSASTHASTLTPAAAIAKFKAAGLPVSGAYKFTAANDPNHLLGRPNGYLAKSAWTDSRIHPRSDPSIDTTRGSVDLGGSIEQFKTAAEAKARAVYIARAEKAVPALGSEYDYVIDASLVRVSQILTPAQARAYDVAAH